MQRGRLIYLMGASGSGKDSLIEAARHALHERGIEVVRRVITRSAEASGEQAMGVSQEAFEQMVAQGRFALNWSANGLLYGIPIEIEQALAAGRWVLMNGSRGYLPHALVKYPDLLVVLVTVNSEALRQRLFARGRETPAEIEARLARNDRLHHTGAAWRGEAPQVYSVDNSTTLQAATAALLTLIDQQRISATED
ncbi:phosphonate metabolism protein/1,5-bisphosphokinase (PRPP-forming) PhnN [Pseudomonas sp. RIT-PI-S]|uniref:phosphonate metabolism protein/1,5-bisphosphokinase (PRPP-forming) PhnN n=1 Tax=Pseudomonas sp. RIT-PI-S TaxID=3035295 RepID=UPI0021D8281C|nr:phosphonate metabolism protein/1,5-bisphosphokinase (PRPP-forming) PhnN [Pseudomonas sp. RIT-PI-S]